MAVVSLTSEVGFRGEETARLGLRLLTECEVSGLLTAEFGAVEVPAAARATAGQSILCRLAAEDHRLPCLAGADRLFAGFASVLRGHLTAPEEHKIGCFMLEHGVDRPAARRRLAAAVRRQKSLMKLRFAGEPPLSHVILEASQWSPELMAKLIHAAC